MTRCKYCDPNGGNYERTVCENKDYELFCEIASEPYTDMSIAYSEKKKKYALVVTAEYQVYAEISFCPFCGRDLAEE